MNARDAATETRLIREHNMLLTNLLQEFEHNTVKSWSAMFCNALNRLDHCCK